MRLLGQLRPEHQSPLQWSSALGRGEQDRTRSGTKRQQAEILYFHSGTVLAFQSKAGCRFSSAGSAIEKCLSALQTNCEIKMLIPFLHCQLLHALVFFLLRRPAAHRIFVSSMRKTRCWCRSKHFSSVTICMHLFTLYLHLSSHDPGLSLREVTVKYLATCLSPFLKPAVMWPRESQTAADCQSWCTLRRY